MDISLYLWINLGAGAVPASPCRPCGVLTRRPSGRSEHTGKRKAYGMELGMLGLGQMRANLRYQCSGHEEQHS
jgi:hypothetical protein